MHDSSVKDESTTEADSNFLKNKISSADVLGPPIHVQIQKRDYSHRRVPRRSHCYKHAFPMRRKVVIEIFTGTLRIRQWTSSELLSALLAKVAVAPSLSDKVCGVEAGGADYEGQNSAPEVTSPPAKRMQQSNDEGQEPSKNRRFRRQRMASKVSGLRKMPTNQSIGGQVPNLRAKDDLAVGLLTQRDLRQLYVPDTNSQSAAIEVRKGCITVCLPPVTAILLHDGVYLIANHDFAFDSLIQSLTELTRQFSGKQTKASSDRSTDTSIFSSSSSEESQTSVVLDELMRAKAARNTRRASLDAIFKPLAAIRQRLQKTPQPVTPEGIASRELHRVSSPSVTYKEVSYCSATAETPENNKVGGKGHRASNRHKGKVKRGRSFVSSAGAAGDLSPRLNKNLAGMDNCVEAGEPFAKNGVMINAPVQREWHESWWHGTVGEVDMTRRHSCFRTPRLLLKRRHRIRERRHKISFEFKAFEVLVVNAFDEICTEIESMEEDLSRFGGDNTQSRTLTVDLELMHHLKAPIEIFRNRVKQMDKAFDELLRDPEDMKRMELWRYRQNPKLYEVQRMHEAPNPDLELLLEYFGQEADNYANRLKQMSQTVENAERLISLKLSVSRNRLIQLDLSATIVGVGIAIGTSLSGLFGMNMPNSLERSHKAFIATSTIIALLIVFSCLSVVFIISKSRL